MLIENGIESVLVYELPCGIWSSGEYFASPSTALVKWRSSLNDKFYQIYVNGQFAGVTFDSQQRQVLIEIPESFESPVRVEVFAVEPEDADVDFSEVLDYPTGLTGRVKITMLRCQKLPAGSTAQIYFDNGTGEIDYSTPLNESPIRIWPSWQDKAGFGMSCFGRSDFGYDSSAAPGFGRGRFGDVQFGFDDDTIEWISPQLQCGTYKFAVIITDEFGNQSEPIETEPITVTPLPIPAEHLDISSFDKQMNELVLIIS